MVEPSETARAARPVAATEPPGWLPLAPAGFLLLWSTGYSAAKLGLTDASPLAFLAVRFALVVALMVPVLAVLRPALPQRRREWLDMAAMGLMLQVAYFGLMYSAMQAGLPAATVALITCLQPLLAAILAPWLTAEPGGGWRLWLGLALGFAGAAITLAARGGLEAAADVPWHGVAAAFGSLAAFTAGTLYQKLIRVTAHPVLASSVQFATAALVTAPLALAFETVRLEWSPRLIACLTYLVLGNSVVSMTLLLTMIRFGQVTRVSALFFLVPPVAALIAWLLLDEVLPPAGWAGLALAAIGVGLARWQPR